MKPSGVPWFDVIPTHWDVMRLAHMGTFLKGRGIARGDITEEGVQAILYGDIYTQYDVKAETLVRRTSAEVAAGSQRLFRGDLLLTGSGETKEDIGKCVVYLGSEPAYAGGDVIIIRQNKAHSLFLSYVLNSLPIVAQKTMMAKGEIVVHIYSSDLRDIVLPLPPIEEQRAIAAFLDERTVRIDGLIARKERLVALLKERRQAIITRAVTRGLDPNAKLKDSGVDWLGEVPEGWAVEKFIRLVKITEGQVNPEVEPYLDMLLIAPNHIESRTGRLHSRETAVQQAAESGKYLCPSGSVVYSKIRPALRKATIAPEECLCSADMYPMTGINGMANLYLLWLILSDSFSQRVVLDSERVAMPKVNRETMNSYWLPLPPRAEQEAIVSYINAQTARIDGVVERVSDAILRLREYRSSLISSAVTGKIRVPQQIQSPAVP